MDGWSDIIALLSWKLHQESVDSVWHIQKAKSLFTPLGEAHQPYRYLGLAELGGPCLWRPGPGPVETDRSDYTVVTIRVDGLRPLAHGLSKQAFEARPAPKLHWSAEEAIEAT
jgi:hypothetical protein